MPSVTARNCALRWSHHYRYRDAPLSALILQNDVTTGSRTRFEAN
jgi:hypothetical protein